jgi:hypothetical protein
MPQPQHTNRRIVPDSDDLMSDRDLVQPSMFWVTARSLFSSKKH